MADVAALNIRVDSRPAVQGANEASKAIGGVGKAARTTEAGVRRTEDSFGKLRRSAFSATPVLRSMAGALAGIGVALSAREIIEQADAMRQLRDRMRLVTDSAAELARAQRDVYLVAKDTRTAFGETANLYVSLARNADTLGASHRDLVTVTKAINESMVVSGASAQGSAAALYQLNQAFTTGVLRGEEFNSVNENASRLMDALASELGVARGELRRMAEEGKLTADVVFNAIRNQAEAINDEFATMGSTVAQATTVARGSLSRLIGTFDGAAGSTSTLADAILKASDGIDKLTDYIETNADSIRRWARGFGAVATTLYAPIRIAFNVGQSIGELANAVLSSVNFMVVEGINLIIRGVNLLPGVNIELRDSARWAAENARAWRAIVDNGRDMIDTLGDVGRAWANVVAPIEAASEAADRAKDKLGPDGAGIPNVDPRLANNGFPLSVIRTPGGNTAAQVEREMSAMDLVWEEAVRGMQRTFADGFDDIFTDGLSGAREFAGSLLGIFRGLASEIAAAMVADKLGLTDIVETIRTKGVEGLTGTQRGIASVGVGAAIGYGSGNAGMGFLGGAASGYAIAGPMGALGGAVAGLAGGLIGAAQKTREAQRIFTESMNNVRQSLEDIRDSAAGITDPMKGLRDQFNQEFDAIRKAFRDRYGTSFRDIDIGTPADVQDEIDRLRRTPHFAAGNRAIREYVEELENLNRIFRESARAMEGTYRESLQDRLDQLTGNDAAVLLRKQQKEREEAIRAGFDATTLALLDQVHEQERLKQATEATSDAIRNVTSALNSPSGLRLSLHRWRATAPGLDPELAPFNPSRDTNIPPMATVNVTFQPGSIVQQPGESGSDLAERVVESLERKQRRGGPAVVNRISSR